MHLKKISLLNFKNYAEAELNFVSAINCIGGKNGEGKTNLLDSIHYLSFCKSFFNPVDSQNIQHDASMFIIQGNFVRKEKEDEIYCGQKRNQKKQFKRNKKEYTRLADHIGLYPLVMISPTDIDLVSEGSEVRRKFIDSAISQYDKDYLDNLIHYNKVLVQRNSLLKRFSQTGNFIIHEMEIWDAQLVDSGNKIYSTRKNFIKEFIPVFQRYYEQISGGKEKVELSYNSQLNKGDFEELLKKAENKDKILEYSTVGIHKDDLEFLMNGFLIKKFGSQGQQKTYLLALKLAQFDFIKFITGITPILLLDDVFAKLDETRVEELMKSVVGKNFGQVFITDTDLVRLEKIFEAKKIKVKYFSVEKGIVKELK